MDQLIDSHCHFDAPELASTGADLLIQAGQRGIVAFVIPGVQSDSWSALMAISDRHPQIFIAPGLHPAHADQWSAKTEASLRALLNHSKVVAIGEIGLDGVAGPSLARQEEVLRAQLQLALESGLPVLLHGRNATGRLLGVLRELDIGAKVGGIWHGFSAGLPVAEELVGLGFAIGVGPILLRPSARKLPEAVRRLPAKALVLETDLPDMAERPEVLLAVAERVAELRDCSLAEVARVTTENVRRLFRRMDF